MSLICFIFLYVLVCHMEPASKKEKSIKNVNQRQRNLAADFFILTFQL